MLGGSQLPSKPDDHHFIARTRAFLPLQGGFGRPSFFEADALGRFLLVDELSGEVQVRFLSSSYRHETCLKGDKTMKRYGIPILLSAALAVGAFTGCANVSSASASDMISSASSTAPSSMAAEPAGSMGSMGAMGGMDMTRASYASEPASGSIIDTSSLFTDRDL